MTPGKKQQYIWWGIIVAIIILTLGGIIWLAANSDGVAYKDQIAVNLPQVTPQDWSWGPTDTKVVLIEYADFQCPACGVYFERTRDLKKDYGDRLRFVFRQYPLTGLHPNGMISAQASEAAGIQEKFWEMEEKLYSNQKEWSSLSRANAKNKFAEYASQLNLDIEKFKTDIDSSETSAKIREDVNGGNAAGVAGTPTLFLNGELIKTPSNYLQLQNVLNTAITDADTTIESNADTTNINQ